MNCALDSLPADEADISCQVWLIVSSNPWVIVSFFSQEKAVALPPRTGGGLISSGTIRFASTALDGTRDYWLLGSFSEKVLKCLENHLKNDENFNPGRRQVVTRVV